MHQHTKENHVKWGWGTHTSWYNKPCGDPTEPFKFTTGQASRPHQGFRQEAIIAATEMAATTNKHIMVAFSGGIDSQVVVIALVCSNIPFTPLIIHYKYGDEILNQHDTQAAFEMCSRYNLIPIVEEIDVNTYWFAKQDFTNKHQIGDVSRLTILSMANKYKDWYFIMGGGDPVLFNLTNEQWTWVHNPTPHLQYFIDENQEGNTKFFWWSPELILSILDNEPMRLFDSALGTMGQTFDLYCNKYGQRRFKMYSELYCDWCKPLVYVDAFPELIQRKKYMGFERIAPTMGPQYTTKLMNQFLPYKTIGDKREVHIPVPQLVSYMKNGGPPQTWFSNSESLIELKNIQ